MSSHGKMLYDTGTMKVRGTAPSSHSTPAGSLDVPHQPDFCSFFLLWSDPAEAMMWLVSSRYWRQPLSSLFKLCFSFFFIFYLSLNVRRRVCSLSSHSRQQVWCKSCEAVRWETISPDLDRLQQRLLVRRSGWSCTHTWEQTHQTDFFRSVWGEDRLKVGKKQKWPVSNLTFKASCVLQSMSNLNISSSWGETKSWITVSCLSCFDTISILLSRPHHFISRSRLVHVRAQLFPPLTAPQCLTGSLWASTAGL